MQSAIFYIAVSQADLSGFVANTLGFAISLLISYFGQSRWTFADRKRRSVPRFLVVALTSFGIGSGGAWLIVDRLLFPPAVMVPIILIAIPSSSFVLMRSWAFKR
jgi:putative flippase GtrA